MPYSEFTLRKAKRDFGLTTVEGGRFLPDKERITPSLYLTESLSEGLPLAIATGSDKARSELIISPILVEVRKILQGQVSLFSGEDFTVDPELGLSGVCDFLISRSPEQVIIEAPAVVIVETSGTAWRFLKLEGQTLTIDLSDYPVPPVEPLLGMLVWMVQSG